MTLWPGRNKEREAARPWYDDGDIALTQMEDGLWRTDDHRYHWVENGVIHVPEGAPGVTTVLKQLDKSGPFWAAASRIVAEKAVMDLDMLTTIKDRDGVIPATEWLASSTRQKQKTAMDLGVRIHKLAETDFRGVDEVFVAGIDPDAQPYMAQYLAKFLLKYNPTFEHIEFMVYSIVGKYGGTGDVICMIGGQRWLIDYKTSDKPIGRGPTQFPYSDVALQLAALARADFMGRPGSAERIPIPHIDRYGVVAITPDDCQLIEYDVTDDEFTAFLLLRGIHEWVKTRKGKVKR
jgi:hypothetical protein